MKKTLFILMCLVTVLFFSSCTPQNEKLIDGDIKQTEKDDIQHPDDRD